MKRIAILAFIILLVFGACSRRPRHVLPETKMVDVLIDIQLAQAIYTRDNQFNNDLKRDALIEGILKKHKITQAELDSSLVWYSDNIEYYETISDSVSSKLKARNNQLSALINTATGKNRPNSFIPTYFNLNQFTPVMAFDIDSFKIKNVDVPKFRLKFNVQGLSDLQQVEAAVFFRYKDTLINEVIPVEKNQLYVLDKPHLADSLLKSVSGYVRLRNKVKGVPLNVALYNISYLDSLAVSAKTDSLSLHELPAHPTSVNRPANTAPAVEEAEVEAEAVSVEKNKD